MHRFSLVFVSFLSTLSFLSGCDNTDMWTDPVGVIHASLAQKAKQALGSLTNPTLDSISVATHVETGRSAITVTFGNDGSGVLFLIEADGHRRELLRTPSETPLTTPHFSKRGDELFFVKHGPATRSQPVEDSALHFHGWLAKVSLSDGRSEVVAGADDVARVLGVLDDETVLITRYEAGDLPAETPFLVQPKAGTFSPVPKPPGNYYGWRFADGQLLSERSDAPVITQPTPDQFVEHVALTPREGVLRRLGSARFLTPTVSTATHLSETENHAVPNLVLSMPYVHQVYDTPDSFNGHWACGPTSTVMALAHFGKLPAWPITVSIPTKHTNNFGGYVSKKYTLYGHTFDRMQPDASGKAAYGAYGHCTDGGAGWAWRMQDYAKKHGMRSDFDGSATFSEVKAALEKGKVVVLSTVLTSAGHIVAVKGYTSDGKLITNDPYGNKNKGYMNYQGEGAVYTWSQVGSKWFITVY